MLARVAAIREPAFGTKNTVMEKNDMKIMHVALVVALLLNSVGAIGQQGISSSPEKFDVSYDAFIGKTMEKIPDIPGIAIVVIKDDKPVFARAYGMADKE